MAGWGNSFSLLDEDESGEGSVRVPPKAAVTSATKPVKEELKVQHKNATQADNKDSHRKTEGRSFERRPPRAREERGDEGSSSTGEAQAQQQGNDEGGDRGYIRQRGGERSSGNGGERTGNGDRSGGERRERGVRGSDTGANGHSQTRAPRQYDRRSGTGRGREEKRGGAGRGNWGSDKEEIQLEERAVEGGEPIAAVTADTWGAATDAGQEWAKKDAEAATGEAGENADQAWGASAGGQQGFGGENKAQAEEKAPRELSEEEKARQEEREKEAKLMTLDEYEKTKKKLDIALPEPRKAGEGEDAKQWAGFVAAKSDKQADAADERAKKQQAGEAERKDKAAKKVPMPADMLRFKGEQQRRDSDRRERGPPRDSDRSYSDRDSRPPRRDNAEPREPRAPRPQQHARPQAKADFGANDFPALKV